MRPIPRPECALAPAPHGGDVPPCWLDFSTGISPLPAPAVVLEAARAAPLHRYPHPTALPFRDACAQAHGVGPEQVVAGAGAAELIWALARAFVGPGRRALVLSPAFAEYAQAVRAQGGEVDELRASAPAFRWDPAGVEAALRERAPAVCFICRPSNPCLSLIPAAELTGWTRAHPDILFVVDESYLPLFDDAEPLRPAPNLAVLRSLTKVFALPGLRLGYLLADAQVAQAVQASLPPWNCSSPAQAAGIVALACSAQVAAVRGQIAALRTELVAGLRASGAAVDAQGGPFVLARLGPAAPARLQKAQLRVRACDSFGLPEHTRLGVRPREEQAALFAALAARGSP